MHNQNDKNSEKRSKHFNRMQAPENIKYSDHDRSSKSSHMISAFNQSMPTFLSTSSSFSQHDSDSCSHIQRNNGEKPKFNQIDYQFSEPQTDISSFSSTNLHSNIRTSRQLTKSNMSIPYNRFNFNNFQNSVQPKDKLNHLKLNNSVNTMASCNAPKHVERYSNFPTSETKPSSPRLDPSQVPRPLTTESEVIFFETRLNNQHQIPPPAYSNYITKDCGNCSPRYHISLY